jgi:hypothetical protein
MLVTALMLALQFSASHPCASSQFSTRRCMQCSPLVPHPTHASPPPPSLPAALSALLFLSSRACARCPLFPAAVTNQSSYCPNAFRSTFFLPCRLQSTPCWQSGERPNPSVPTSLKPLSVFFVIDIRFAGWAPQGLRAFLLHFFSLDAADHLIMPPSSSSSSSSSSSTTSDPLVSLLRSGFPLHSPNSKPKTSC